MENLKKFLIDSDIAFLEKEDLAKYTTWKVGGPADIFIDVERSDLMIKLLKATEEYKVPLYILGGGSNVLISDQGFKGIVLKNSISGIELITNEEITTLPLKEVNDVRLSQIDKEEYYSFEELDYDESNNPKIKVAIYSGTLLSYSINKLIMEGITGLQWFAGIPGTIGGAVFNNIHGGTHFLSEYLVGVDLIDEMGNIIYLANNELDLGYDHSRLQYEKKFIHKAYFSLYKGDTLKAQKTAIAWASAKRRKQPYNSAGCSFKNLTKDQMNSLNLPSDSWGYIIDNILNLKGTKIGQAMISNAHAAFIETYKGARAEDILQLLELIHEKAKQKIGITPKTEIFFVGFPKERIEKFL